VAVFATVLGVFLSSDEASKEPEGFPSFTDEEIIATAPKTICYERHPGAGESKVCSVNETLSQGGGVVNLVAQAFLDQYPEGEADIVLLNAGFCRNDILEGAFTGSDADNLFPYRNNRLIRLEMTGMDLKLVLESALEWMVEDPNESHPSAYPYAAGLKFAVDMSDKVFSRLSDMQIRQSGEWVVYNPAAKYTVLANSFIASGKYGYSRLAEIENAVDTQLETSETFLRYAWEQGTLLDPSLEDYSTISYIPPSSQPVL
jgi:5'-nucleotidase